MINKKISDFSKRDSHVSPKQVSLLKGNFSFLKRKSLNKKAASSIELLLIITSIFAFSFMMSDKVLVSASEPTVCCQETSTQGRCLNVPATDCSADSLSAPTFCEYTSYCQSGTCYNPDDGSCTQGVPQDVCEYYDNGNPTGATWDERSIDQVPQCQLGCCIIADQAAFVTLTKCKSITPSGVENVFRTDITDELSCVALAQSQDMGACVYEQEYERKCEYITRSECDGANPEYDKDGNLVLSEERTFYNGMYCSEPELSVKCDAASTTTCYQGDVYNVDSCGNREDVKEDCDYLEGTRCQATGTFGGVNHECKSTSCTIDTSLTTGDKTELLNGESICVNPSSDGANAFSAGANGVPTVTSSGEKVGSRYFKMVCRDGDLVTEPCADYRNEICVQGSIDVSDPESPEDDFKTANCRVNRWQDCAFQNESDDCLDESERDCKWYPYFTGLLLGTNGSSSGEDGGVCLPAYAPGQNFWESGSTDEICYLGNAECSVVKSYNIFGGERGEGLDIDAGALGEAGEWLEGALSMGSSSGEPDCGTDDWIYKANQVCASLGDCGGAVNYANKRASGGYIYTTSIYNETTEEWDEETSELGSGVGSGVYPNGTEISFSSDTKYPLSFMLTSFLTGRVIGGGITGMATYIEYGDNIWTVDYTKKRDGKTYFHVLTATDEYDQWYNEDEEPVEDTSILNSLNNIEYGDNIWTVDYTKKIDGKTYFHVLTATDEYDQWYNEYEEPVEDTSILNSLNNIQPESDISTESAGDYFAKAYGSYIPGPTSTGDIDLGLDATQSYTPGLRYVGSTMAIVTASGAALSILDEQPYGATTYYRTTQGWYDGYGNLLEEGAIELDLESNYQASVDSGEAIAEEDAENPEASASKEDKEKSELQEAWDEDWGFKSWKGFNASNFGWENTFESLGAAAGAAVGGYVAGNFLVGLIPGADEYQSNAAGLGLATFTSTLTFLDKWGFTSEFSSGQKLLISGVAGIGVFLLTYSDKEDITYTFECLPYEAPDGGDDCDQCNNDDFPCSEYSCMSLGKTCELVNKGTEEERCVNINPNDATPPVIYPDENAFSESLFVDNDERLPAGEGFILEYENSQNDDGCIPAFTSIRFGITTKDPSDSSANGRGEPAQCKIDYESTDSFEQMISFMSEGNLYDYNHTQEFTLPSAADLNASGFELQNGEEMSFFIRCRDKSGNENDAEFEVRFCVDDSPDTTAPEIMATSAASGSCVGNRNTEADVTFYTDEPSDCRWSDTDQDYGSMPQVNAMIDYDTASPNEYFAHEATLTGIGIEDSAYYIRCQDDEPTPNAMSESYAFSLHGSAGLISRNLQPNGTETIFGVVNPTPVELYIETSMGCDDGLATCRYLVVDENSDYDDYDLSDYVAFYDTYNVDGVHTQKLNLGQGNFDIYTVCEDDGGNQEFANTSVYVDIDPNAPIVARVYEEAGTLKIVTVRESDCVYTFDSCDYEFNEGIEMPYSASTVHVAEWNSEETYYIKCQDEYIPAEASCSIIVRPTEGSI